MTSEIHDVQFQWRTVRADEANTVHALHLEALAGLQPGLVRPDTLSHFVSHTGPLGLTLGGFVDDVGMVAYGVLGIASDTARHIAEIAGVEQAELDRFGILDGAASLPAWRGHHLHRELIRERLAHAEQAGRTLIGATVAPGNIISLRGLLDAHFQIGRFAMLYGGLPRLVLKRDLLAPAPQWVLEHRVAAADIPAHQSALAEGLIGFACSEEEGGMWQVHYGHAAIY